MLYSEENWKRAQELWNFLSQLQAAEEVQAANAHWAAIRSAIRSAQTVEAARPSEHITDADLDMLEGMKISWIGDNR
jgi:hypothetical protein